MRVKTPSQETKIRSLSGGNQQKVILGRWLLTDPTVLLLDEPTRGIDVGAKYEIYQLIIDMAEKGKTVLMVSSEMPELLGVCDRILVMSAASWPAKWTQQRPHRKKLWRWPPNTLKNGGDKMAAATLKRKTRLAAWLDDFKAKPGLDKRRTISDLLFNNAMYIIILLAIIYIAIRVPAFLSTSSIVNIISLTAAKLPIALGIGGAIVLTGTDISAGRCVGLTACIAASLLQMTTYSNKIFPNLAVMPLWLVLLIVIAVGALIGFVNGFFVAKFKLHPFIVTLSTQLIVFGLVLMYLMLGGNNGQTLSGLDTSYTDFVRGALFTDGGDGGARNMCSIPWC